MRLSEIAEYIVDNYPYCCLASNHDFIKGCREDWYEESLIDSLMDFFSFELIDMCGCGCPEDTHELIRKILTIRSEWQDKKISYEEIKNRYKNDLDLDDSNNNHYGALQFIFYILDGCGIIEHGSNIGGCWLTDLGKKYLTVLNAWHDREEKEKKENDVREVIRQYKQQKKENK